MIGEAFEGDSNLQPLDAVLGDLGRARGVAGSACAIRNENGRDARQDALGRRCRRARQARRRCPAWKRSSRSRGRSERRSSSLATTGSVACSAPIALMLFAAEGSHLRPRSARGFRRDDLDSIVVGGRRRYRRPHLHGAAGAHRLEHRGRRGRVHRAVSGQERHRRARTRGGRRVVGVLYAGRRADGRPFGPSDVLLLLVIADRIGRLRPSIPARPALGVDRTPGGARGVRGGGAPRSRPDGHPVAGGGGRMSPRGRACGSRGRRRGGLGGGRRTRAAGRSGFLAVDLAT